MSRKATPGFAALADENARLVKAFDDLSEAYDLLHKRIEAYDETHAYLQELREAAEALLAAFKARGIVKHYHPEVVEFRAVLAKVASDAALKENERLRALLDDMFIDDLVDALAPFEQEPQT